TSTGSWEGSRSSRLMTTDVSSTPRRGRGASGTRRGALIRNRVQIGPERSVINGRRGAEQRHGCLGGDETVAPQRGQLADRHTVARHDERHARIEAAHDLPAVVAELPLRDLLGHAASVARGATEVGVRCHDPAFRDLRPADSSVRFHRCRLGYYALPPREVQRISPPVFALDGTVSTPALERYDFTR